MFHFTPTTNGGSIRAKLPLLVPYHPSFATQTALIISQEDVLDLSHAKEIIALAAKNTVIASKDNGATTFEEMAYWTLKALRAYFVNELEMLKQCIGAYPTLK